MSVSITRCTKEGLMIMSFYFIRAQNAKEKKKESENLAF